MVCVAIRGLYLLGGYRSRLTNHEKVTTMNHLTRASNHAISQMDRDSRAIVKLARKAANNAIFGGASAIVIAERLDRMGCRFDAESIVTETWTCGTRDGYSLIFDAYECPECGSAHVGQEAAYACCAETIDYWTDNEAHT